MIAVFTMQHVCKAKEIAKDIDRRTFWTTLPRVFLGTHRAMGGHRS